MQRTSDTNLILVYRKTRLEELVARYNTLEQTKFYIESHGSHFDDYMDEHSKYKEVIRHLEVTLHSLGRVQCLERTFIPNYVFGETDIIIVVGQDGLVANTIKYLSVQPIIAINPDASRYDGVLLPFDVKSGVKMLECVLSNRYDFEKITMAKVTLNDGQHLLAVNDFFIGQKTHVSSRYQLYYGEEKERQSSSGIIVSTGLGSTGWLKSVLAGASNVYEYIYGNKMRTTEDMKLKRSDRKLIFSVREPFATTVTGTSLGFGIINDQKHLKVESFMSENGVIFSDGIESDYLEFNAGMIAEVGIADSYGRLVI